VTDPATRLEPTAPSSPPDVRVGVEEVVRLRFPDGSPVRAASAIAPLGPGFLVAQDDATHGCLLTPGGGTRRVRLLPAVEGRDLFGVADGTKHLKPDLEAACALPGPRGGVLLLGSGSTAARMRGVVVGPDLTTEVRDLAPTYAAVAAALDLAPDVLNLEGACVVGGRVRWFQRRPAASVELDLPDLTLVGGVRRHDLGRVGGVELGITDAVAVPGGVLVAAAAEDSPNSYEDGPVVASALVLLPDDGPPVVAPLPEVEGRVAKVEGLALLDWSAAGGRLLAVVDADDPVEPSALLTLRVDLDRPAGPAAGQR
jgi:hypothetical protein